MTKEYLPAGTTTIDKTIKPPDNTTYEGVPCVLISPDSYDKDTVHKWIAKVRANFVYEQCEHCDKIRNKKKLV